MSLTTITSKEIKDIRLDNIKLLEENVGKKQCLGSDFFSMTPKGQTTKTKTNTWTTSKSEASAQQNQQLLHEKITYRMGDNFFKPYIR